MGKEEGKGAGHSARDDVFVCFDFEKRRRHAEVPFLIVTEVFDDTRDSWGRHSFSDSAQRRCI